MLRATRKKSFFFESATLFFVGANAQRQCANTGNNDRADLVVGGGEQQGRGKPIQFCVKKNEIIKKSLVYNYSVDGIWGCTGPERMFILQDCYFVLFL